MKKILGKRATETRHSLEAYGCSCGCISCTCGICDCDSVHPDAQQSMSSGISSGTASVNSAESGRVHSTLFHWR